MLELTQDEVKKTFEYRDGALYWRESPKHDIPAGSRAGGSVGNRKYNYRRISLGQRMKAPEHRLIFLWHHGYLPDLVDHIDGDPTNNLIENLRPANRAENNANKRIPANNSSGVKNVSWSNAHKKWLVQVVFAHKHHHIGYFNNIEDAAKAADKARREIYGEFAKAA